MIALLALFVAIGGSATAAGLISGSKIKPNTITAKAFKKGTITKSKISPAAITALAGAVGPQGEKGEPGEKGPAGNQGEPGAPGTKTITGVVTKVGQAANLDVNQVVLNNLGGHYVAMARVTALSQTAGSTVTCRIEATQNGGTDEAKWTNPANNTRGTLWMSMGTQAQTGSIKVVCNAGSSSATFKTTLTLIPS